jgi:peptide deformylase
MLPITAYGHPTLKVKGEDIRSDYPGLKELIDDMFETMYEAKGVGLAAQQINRAIRLFVIDASPYADEFPELDGFKKVFINAHIVAEEGEEWDFEEGCLSVPGIQEFVRRKPVVYLNYYDEDWNYHENERFDGLIARIIQHEYDHTDGVVFIERLPHFKRVLLKSKLKDISTGKAEADYKMILPRLRKKAKR